MEKTVKFSDIIIGLKDDYKKCIEQVNGLRKYLEICNPIVEDYQLALDCKHPCMSESSDMCIIVWFKYKPKLLFKLKEKLGVTHYSSYHQLIHVDAMGDIIMDGLKGVRVTDEKAFKEELQKVQENEFAKDILYKDIYLNESGNKSLFLSPISLELYVRNGAWLRYYPRGDRLKLYTEGCAHPMTLKQSLEFPVPTDNLGDHINSHLGSGKEDPQYMEKLIASATGDFQRTKTKKGFRGERS